DPRGGHRGRRQVDGRRRGLNPGRGRFHGRRRRVPAGVGGDHPVVVGGGRAQPGVGVGGHVLAGRTDLGPPAGPVGRALHPVAGLGGHVVPGQVDPRGGDRGRREVGGRRGGLNPPRGRGHGRRGRGPAGAGGDDPVEVGGGRAQPGVGVGGHVLAGRTDLGPPAGPVGRPFHSETVLGGPVVPA